MPVPPELPDSFVAAPGPAAPIEPVLDDEPDSVLPALPRSPVAPEDGPAGRLLPDDVPVEEPAAAGLSGLVELLVPRSAAAGALSLPCAYVAALAPSNEINSANDSFFMLPPSNVNAVQYGIPRKLQKVDVRLHAFRQFDFSGASPKRWPTAIARAGIARGVRRLIRLFLNHHSL